MVDTLNMITDRSKKVIAGGRHSAPPSVSVDDASLDQTDDRIAALAKYGKLAKAAKAAIRRQKAKGIAVTYKQGLQIIKEHADGRKEVLGVLRSEKYELPKTVRVLCK